MEKSVNYMTILYVPSEEGSVEHTLIEHNIDFERIKNFNDIENSPGAVPEKSVLFMDIDGLLCYFDNEYFWQSFFEKKCHLVIMYTEGYKFQCGFDTEWRVIEFMNQVPKYQMFHQQIHMLSGARADKKSDYFNFFPITDIEFPELFLKYKFQPINFQRKYNICMLSNNKRHRPVRSAFFNFLKQHKQDVFISDNNFVSDQQESGVLDVLTKEENFYTKFYDISKQENSYFEIVLETNQNSGATVISEKVCKTMIACTPFIVLADKDFYNTLHSLGFKTFNGIIDESWASLECTEEKFFRIKNEIDKIENMGFKEFYKKTFEICRYNYNHMSTVASNQYRLKQHRILQLLNFIKNSQ